MPPHFVLGVYKTQTHFNKSHINVNKYVVSVFCIYINMEQNKFFLHILLNILCFIHDSGKCIRRFGGFSATEHRVVCRTILKYESEQYIKHFKHFIFCFFKYIRSFVPKIIKFHINQQSKHKKKKTLSR